MPPFEAEHEELRATVRRWVESGDRAPSRASGSAGASSRASSSTAPASSASSVSSTRSDSAARAATASTTPSGPRRSRPPACAAASAPGSAPTPGSRRHRSATSAPTSSTSASCGPAIAGEKIAALGITEPGAGSDVASIRTTAKRVDGGWVVNGSKTFITNGVRADFLVCAVRTTQRGRPRRDLVPDPRARDAGLRGLAQAREAGLALLRHGRARRSPTSRSRTRTCSARRTRASS